MISDWAQLSGILTDCWWRQRQSERDWRIKPWKIVRGKNQLSKNLSLINCYPIGVWLACISLYMVFCLWWYEVFEYSVYLKWSAMFWVDWPPRRQLKHKMPSQVSWILSTGWLVYIHEWTTEHSVKGENSSNQENPNNVQQFAIPAIVLLFSKSWW